MNRAARRQLEKQQRQQQRDALQDAARRAAQLQRRSQPPAAAGTATAEPLPALPAWDDPVWDADGTAPLHIALAGDLEPHLHANEVAPDRRLFTPPSMDPTRPRGWRNEPEGGLWTTTPDVGANDFAINFWVDNATAAYSERQPEVWRHQNWFRMHPHPDARVIVIDNQDDFSAALARFPYGPRWEIDYVAVARAGFAAVHLTMDGKETLPAFNIWNHDSTVWLRWAFARPAELVRAAEVPRPREAYERTAQAQRREHLRRVAAGEEPGKAWGWWLHRDRRPRVW